MEYIILTPFVFALMIAVVCVFSLGFGYWCGKLKGRADEQMRQFYDRNVKPEKGEPNSEKEI